MTAATETAPVFSREDTVMHPSEGVCQVQEVRRMRFGSLPEQAYYVLKPSAKSGSSVVYLPVARGNEILRRLLGPAEIDGLIRDSRELPPLWIAETKQRKESFLRVLRSGDYAQVIRMITEIRAHGEARIAAGKKPCVGDESVREEAERLLHEEFSLALGLSREDTINYIRERLAAS